MQATAALLRELPPEAELRQRVQQRQLAPIRLLAPICEKQVNSTRSGTWRLRLLSFWQQLLTFEKLHRLETAPPGLRITFLPIGRKCRVHGLGTPNEEQPIHFTIPASRIKCICLT